METMKHQEWRSRQTISGSAVLKAGLGMGLALFIFSGGTPWSTAGTMNAVMGRYLPYPYAVLFFLQLMMAVGYMFLTAFVIFRFRVIPAIFAGVAVALGLYALNRIFFGGLGYAPAPDEARVILVHIVFGLFGSVVYKALSVPRPMMSNRGDDWTGRPRAI